MSSSSDNCEAYCDRHDVELVYGRTNIEKWASLDNDQDEDQISDRIAWANCLATERLNNDLRNGPYEIPFVDPCREIVDLTARLSGAILYDSRGIADTNGEGNPVDNLEVHRKFVKNRVVEICQGRVRLNHTEKAAYFPLVASDD